MEYILASFFLTTVISFFTFQKYFWKCMCTLAFKFSNFKQPSKVFIIIEDLSNQTKIMGIVWDGHSTAAKRLCICVHVSDMGMGRGRFQSSGTGRVLH